MLQPAMATCSARAVPAGYVVTRTAHGETHGCRGGYLRFWITNQLYGGVQVCSAAALPPGWRVTHRQSGGDRCYRRYLLDTVARA